MSQSNNKIIHLVKPDSMSADGGGEHGDASALTVEPATREAASGIHVAAPGPREAASGIRLPYRFFVTGTDTDVGKTFVCAMLQMGIGAAYWKPVQCGLEPSSDSDWIRRLVRLDESRYLKETYKLTAPLSPHLAAEREKIKIAVCDFSLPRSSRPGTAAEPVDGTASDRPAADGAAADRLIVEGAGGVLVPLNQSETMLDLMCHLGLPVLVVARGSLGTINHTLLTLSALRQRNLNVIGVVMNGERNYDNKRSIEHFGGVPVLAQIERLEDVTRKSMRSVFEREFRRYV